MLAQHLLRTATVSLTLAATLLTTGGAEATGTTSRWEAPSPGTALPNP